jgi:acetyltransferase-like isoleucine patch superfamily enzyme
MPETTTSTKTDDLTDAYRRLREFRQGKSNERVFSHPTCHPALPTGFCFCEKSLGRALLFYLKAILLAFAFKLPLNWLKVWTLRRLGARVGNQVYFSAGVWIDPMFPELLTIEDCVFFGMDVKILTHEFGIDEFRAGKVFIRRGAFVGGFATVRCGVEIGEGAVVAACSVAYRDVPPGATLISAPPMIVKCREATQNMGTEEIAGEKSQ